MFLKQPKCECVFFLNNLFNYLDRHGAKGHLHVQS